MGENPSKADGELEFLSKNGLERVVAFCSSEGVRVGHFFRSLLGYTTQGGIDYVHGEIRDRRTGHYRLKDGSEAFGGPQETACTEFEDIDGVPHLRVPAEGGKTALNDPEGNVYTGQTYDTIKRDHDSTPLEGIVYRVTNDGKEGYFLNGELCGRHNGMNLKSTIVREGDEKAGYKIFLIAENEKSTKDTAEGEEGAKKKKRVVKKVIDINTGDIKYRDEDKCTDVKLEMIGMELCAVKAFGTEEQGNLEQAIRAENGDQIYHGVLQARVGTWFYGPGKNPVVRMYTPENWLVPINRRGRPCFTKEPVPMEAEDGPEGDGLYRIDGVLYMKLHLLKENPRDEDDKFIIVYRTADIKDGFGGPHDEEVLSVEGRPNTVTVSGVTGKIFKNRTAKTMYWMGSNGTRMFKGEHWDDLKTIEWLRDSEGRRTEGARILKHFEDVARGHTVLDFQGRTYFMNKDSATPEHHTDIRDFLVLSYKKDGGDRNVLIAEAEDPVGLGRRTKSFLSNLAHFWRGQILKMPSTYYLMDGTKADSIDALMKHLGAPGDAKLRNVNNFKDAIVKTSRPRDTQMMKAVSPDAPSVGPVVQKLLDQAEATSRGKPADNGSAEAPDSQPAAYAGVDGVPASAEEAPGQLPDGNGGDPPEGEQLHGQDGPAWLTDESPGGGEQPQKTEPEPKGDAGTEKAPDRTLSSFLFDDIKDKGKGGAEQEE